jgi:quinoprotein relay system zinc metallohydrolase 2
MRFHRLTSSSGGAYVLIALLFYVPLCFASGDAVSLAVVEVAPGIYVHKGRHAGIEDQERGDSANIGFIIGDDCVAVIDTGGSIATGKALRAAIRNKTPLPVCYVINTHIHFDHVLGNAAFLEDQPVFIGHENLGPAMDASRDFFVEQFAAEFGENPSGTLVISPTRLVAERLDLDLGGRQIRLLAERTAHSDNDVTVLDLKTKTLWTGDLLFMERLPVLDGSLKGWLRWLDDAVSSDYLQVVPGHGPARAAWPDAARMLRNYLEQLLAETREAVSDGQFLEDAMRTVGQEAIEGWLLTARAHPRNVSKAYRELEWE